MEMVAVAELQVPAGGTRGQRSGRRVEMKGRAALDPVEAGIGEADAAIVEPRGAHRAATRPLLAAHLEQVGEVGAERDLERNGRRQRTEAPQPETLVAGAVAQELEPAEIEAVALQPDPALGIVEVGIGEIDDQRAIVVDHDRAEQQRREAAEPELQIGEEARVLEIEAVRTALAAAEVALLVEDAEQIVVLEGPQRPVDERLGRLDMIAFRPGMRFRSGPFGGGDDFVHAVQPATDQRIP